MPSTELHVTHIVRKWRHLFGDIYLAREVHIFTYSPIALVPSPFIEVKMSTHDKLLIQDTRTKNRYEIPIENNSIPAAAFKNIKGHVEGSRARDRVANGLRIYDPGLVNTAVAHGDSTWVLVTCNLTLNYIC